jgi:hypothetical protein
MLLWIDISAHVCRPSFGTNYMLLSATESFSTQLLSYDVQTALRPSTSAVLAHWRTDELL